MLARLRLLLAMSLLCLGAWFAALALDGYWPATIHTERLVVAKSQPNSHVKPQSKSPLEANSPQAAGIAKAAAVEKRRPVRAAQSPWPLNLFDN
jgi:hypothetical protein